MKTRHSFFVVSILALTGLGSCVTSKKPAADTVIPAFIPPNAVVADLTPDDLPLSVYIDGDRGVIWVTPGYEDQAASDYNAERSADGWMIEIFGKRRLFKMQNLNDLNRQQPVAQLAAGTIQGINCTDTVEKGIPVGACINMVDVRTGAFAFSWRVPAGGLSWCGDPGGRCQWLIVGTGNNVIFPGRNCTGDPIGPQRIRVCRADTT